MCEGVATENQGLITEQGFKGGESGGIVRQVEGVTSERLKE